MNDQLDDILCLIICGFFILLFGGVFYKCLSLFFLAIKAGSFEAAILIIPALLVSFLGICVMMRMHYNDNRKLQKYIHLRKIRKYKERKK